MFKELQPTLFDRLAKRVAMFACLMSMAAVFGDGGSVIPEEKSDDAGVEYLGFGKSVVLYGLCTAHDETSGAEYYAGTATLTCGKTGKGGKTKWKQSLALEEKRKISVSGTDVFSLDYDGKKMTKNDLTYTLPAFDWSPLMFTSSVGGYEVRGEVYNAGDQRLSMLKGKSFSIKFGELSVVSGTLPDRKKVSAALKVEIGKKGVVKIKGSSPDGSKVSAESHVVGFDVADGSLSGSIPVYVKTSKGKGGYGFWISINYSEGQFEASVGKVLWHGAFGYDNVVEVDGEVGEDGGGSSGSVEGAFTFTASEPDSEALSNYVESLNKSGEKKWTEAYILEDFNRCYNIVFKNGKFKVPKSGKMSMRKYTEDGEVVYEPVASKMDNPIGLQLSYKSKTGVVKGSYNLYVVVNKCSLKKAGEDTVEVCKPALKKIKISLVGRMTEDGVQFTQRFKKADAGEAYLER